MFTPPRQHRALQSSQHPNIPHPTTASAGFGKANTCARSPRGRMGDEMSDSDVSSSAASPSTTRQGRCFCGRQVPGSEGGIYCSVACARSDAFSSLCYRSNSISGQPSFQNEPKPLEAITAQILSRDPSDGGSTASGSGSGDDWTASHYRRLARAESRRDERREERRRRRAENLSTSSRSTVMSTSSSVSRNVPELVGGHSRNPSLASSISSAYSASTLSRNPSSASTASSRRYGGGVHVNSVIMEDDDEDDWRQQRPLAEPKPYTSTPHHKSHRKRGSNSGLSVSRRKHLDDIGMGKDMRDVLEEIIRMEKGFDLSDSGEKQATARHVPSKSTSDNVSAGLYTAAFDRPPRTPSPMNVDRRDSQAPGAPRVHRRSTVSHPDGAPMLGQSGSDLLDLPPLPAINGSRVSRPSSFMGGHQSSLSESHTALYLATASPAQAKLNPFSFITGSSTDGNGGFGSGTTERRSASPKLQARKSLTFTPEADGPSISTLPILPFRGSIDGSTPSRRKGSTTGFHGSMNGWKFPTSNSKPRTESGNVSSMYSTAGSGGSNAATPTRPPPINTNVPGSSLCTPSRPSHHGQNHQPFRRPISPSNASNETGNATSTSPQQLLWPPSAFPPPPLAPALFPCSPANATPDYNLTMSSGHHVADEAPNSGLRLGVLLGSGESDEDEDVDMDDREDDSTAHGHGYGNEQRQGGGYLPVFLEAEGFRSEGMKW